MMGLWPIIIKSNGLLGRGMGAPGPKSIFSNLSNSRGNKPCNLEPYFQNQNERVITFSMRRKMCIYKCMLNVYKNQQNRQTGSRNLMGPKTLLMIWGTYMKLVTKYQISAIYMYMLYTYAHFSSHFSQQILMAEIWYMVTSFIEVPHIVGSVFGPIRLLLPVCIIFKS
jgi:hypothetical protein